MSREVPSDGAGDPRNLIGPRIRRLRQEQGLTLVGLGSRTGLTHAFLSQVERGLSYPSLRTLGRISSALGVSVGSLLQVPIEGQAHAPQLTRAGEPSAVIFTGDSGSFTMSALTTTTSSFHALIADGHHPAARVTGHAGEELVLVIEGALEMTVDGTVYRLERGDALCFDASVPHEYHTVGDAPPRFLVVVGDPAGLRAPTNGDGRNGDRALGG